MNKKLFNVGEIVNTHGIHGEMKIYRISDFEDRFEVGKKLYLVQKNKPVQEVVIASHRVHKGFDLLTFEGYHNINEVEVFKGASLKIEEEQLTELAKDEYYYHEIIGCEVFTTSNEFLGLIEGILSPGANDVFVVKSETDNEILIPNIKSVVKSIDVNNRKIVIDPMEGLLD